MVQARQWIALIAVASLLQIRLSISFQPWGLSDRSSAAIGSFLRSSSKADEDWRAFRAKLVMNETASKNSSPSSSWAYDTGLLVERGSIVISRVESSLGCHDLQQPYFCKCVVLIVEHEDEFTQGIILNRPSNLDLNDQDIMYFDDEKSPLIIDSDKDSDHDHDDEKEEDNNSLPMFFGGDIAGLDDEDPLILCLHNLTSELSQSVSADVLPGVQLTGQSGAHELVNAGEATLDSFYNFYGFCEWDPGQLEKEVKRGSWYMVSADPGTIWSELEALREPTNDPRSAGLNMWRGILEKLERGDEAGEPDTFSDLMLKEWATQMLMVSKDDDSIDLEDSDIYRALNAADQPPVGVGTLLRGSSLQVSPFLLQDQFFHKSVILILQETDSLSVGITLNLPTSESYTVDLSDGSTVDFAIRYGGPSGDDGAEPLLWLHCSEALKKMGVGKPIPNGDVTGVWTCTIDQVIHAIETGFDSGDFILVQGFCKWEKEAGSGGILGQVMSGQFEAITTNNLNNVWALLRKQNQLSEDSLTANFEIALNAWNLGDGKEKDELQQSRFVFDSNVKVSALADNALLAWIEIFLLGNGEYVS
jgi:putative AlgH/UPF0301 family transcriptional regulator